MASRSMLAAGLLLLTVAANAGEHPYSVLVNKVGDALKVSPTLIHAVISAESDYRPAAVSSAGAVGLMQLVPRYGAREAYQYLYKADRIPTDQALKRPEVSVWLGTAYLRILDRDYFSWIKNPAQRLRAVVAAYNWGPGAVLKKLLPDRNDTVSVAGFMHKLDTQAPAETRAYVRRVLKKLRILQASKDQSTQHKKS